MRTEMVREHENPISIYTTSTHFRTYGICNGPHTRCPHGKCEIVEKKKKLESQLPALTFYMQYICAVHATLCSVVCFAKRVLVIRTRICTLFMNEIERWRDINRQAATHIHMYARTQTSTHARRVWQSKLVLIHFTIGIALCCLYAHY